MTPVANDSTQLRRALMLDAVASGGMGVLLLLGAGPLDPLLGLPASLLRGLGLFLIPFAGFLVWLAPRASGLRGVVRLVVGGNVLWVLASVLLLVSAWVTPTLLGTLFVALQSAAVAVFAYLEHRAVARGGGRLVRDWALGAIARRLPADRGQVGCLPAVSGLLSRPADARDRTCGDSQLLPRNGRRRGEQASETVRRHGFPLPAYSQANRLAH